MTSRDSPISAASWPQAGNTVVVVEHDRGFIEAADHVVELGPGSGDRGGEIVFAGTQAEFRGRPALAHRALPRGRETIAVPARSGGPAGAPSSTGAREHNLRDVTLRVPLGTLTVVTGVSGSGKSTLVHDTLYRAVARAFKADFAVPGAYERFTGLEYLKGIRLIDQEPIGRTPRSNPVTYVKAFDEIRKLFAALPRAKALGLGAGLVLVQRAGRALRDCEGDGFQKLEMYFFEDVYVTCQECEGRRYRPDVLDREASAARHRRRAAHDRGRRGRVLRWPGRARPPAQRAAGRRPRLSAPRPARHHAVGRRGAAAEDRRRAGRRARPRDVLYILDEPTTGLHLDDVRKLLGVLHRLVDAGNTVLVVEHHLDVIKCADWVMDLGPEGGEAGGEIVAEGTPETVARRRGSYTGKFLAELLAEARREERRLTLRGGSGRGRSSTAGSSSPAPSWSLFVAYGAQYSFSVFFAALLDEFGWSRASLAGGLLRVRVRSTAPSAFLAGRFTDRWGPLRGHRLLGGVLLGLAMARDGDVSLELWQVYVLYGGRAAALGMGYGLHSLQHVRSCGGSSAAAGWPPASPPAEAALGTPSIPPHRPRCWSSPPRMARPPMSSSAPPILVLLNVGGAGDATRSRELWDSIPTATTSRPRRASPVRRRRLGPAVRRDRGHCEFWPSAAAFTATWIPVFVPLVHVRCPWPATSARSPLVAAALRRRATTRQPAPLAGRHGDGLGRPTGSAGDPRWP